MYMLKAAAVALVIFSGLVSGGVVLEQNSAPAADVASPQAIVTAAYDSISGPATQERDWNRLRSLFLPGAHFIQSTPDADGKYTTNVLSMDEFVAAATPYFKEHDFYEREL
jgi:hypothetical protein